MKKSKIWLISVDVLKNIVLNSKSITNVLRELGYKNPRSGRNRNDLKERLLKENIDFSHFDGSRIEFKTYTYPLEEILVENSTYTKNSSLKIRLVNEGYLEYKCAKCGNTGEWNGLPLSLHLDHINGINNDHRIENLRFLCPNCHSQTATYAGKNNEKVPKLRQVVSSGEPLQVVYKCTECGTKLSRKRKTGLCRKCLYKKYQNVERPSKDELLELIKHNSFLSLGKKFSVSDNTIRKWCKSYGIDYKNK